MSWWSLGHFYFLLASSASILLGNLFSACYINFASCFLTHWRNEYSTLLIQLVLCRDNFRRLPMVEIHRTDLLLFWSYSWLMLQPSLIDAQRITKSEEETWIDLFTQMLTPEFQELYTWSSKHRLWLTFSIIVFVSFPGCQHVPVCMHVGVCVELRWGQGVHKLGLRGDKLPQAQPEHNTAPKIVGCLAWTAGFQ